MAGGSTLDQITDGIASDDLIAIGAAPAAAMAMVDVAMATSMGLAMSSASRTQSNGQLIASTATAIATTQILSRIGSPPK